MKKSNWAATGFGKYVSPDLINDELLDAEVVVLFEGKNLFGDQVFCYLQLTCASLKEVFRKIQYSENFRPADFGNILVAGRGELTPELRAEMRNEYNIIDVPKPQPPFKIDSSQPKFFDEE